ncbi:hypothetical protein B0O99DRAFT_654154 [Bisporella sp. PMI_857]|nr:hypothetical protein B0O99DRAFT_654154 [Bisporella sp. PMI_857]
MLEQADNYQGLINQRRQRWPEGEDDNSLYALYRLYEELMLNNRFNLRNEIEYFWNRHQWAVKDIPDPKDDDAERYAFLAGIPHLLVEAFNRNIGRGLPRDAPSVIADEEWDELNSREEIFEELPLWVSEVSALPEMLIIPRHNEVLKTFDDERASPGFKEKNILLPHPHIHFI